MFHKMSDLITLRAGSDSKRVRNTLETVNCQCDIQHIYRGREWGRILRAQHRVGFGNRIRSLLESIDFLCDVEYIERAECDISPEGGCDDQFDRSSRASRFNADALRRK